MALADDLKFPIDCPHCGHKSQKSVAWLKRHREFECPGCGVRFDANDPKTRTALKEIEDALGEFERTIQQFWR